MTRSSLLPVLYPEPLPTDRRELLREKLRRVVRTGMGGPNTLMYRLVGIAGEWSLMPENYYLIGRDAPKHKGRKGPFIVTERVDDDDPSPYNRNWKKDGEKQTFPSEAEAWAWVTAEHDRRVGANFPALVEDEARRCDENAAIIRRKLEDVEQEAKLWRSWLEVTP